jgi:hypothetical protein
VISKHEAVRRLIAVCPGFQDSLTRYLDTDARLDEAYNVMGELANWVVEQMRANDFTCFSELFDEFERVLSEADPDAQQVLVIAFLEDVHNFGVWFQKPADRADPDVLLPYLGPQSRIEWFGLVRWYVNRGEPWPGRIQND